MMTIHDPRGLPETHFLLTGKNALVTGGAKNIGLEITAAYLQRGANVMIVDIEPERLAQAESRLQKFLDGNRVITVHADLGTVEGAEKIEAAVKEEFGILDILVNNAHNTGHTQNTPALEITRETWQSVFDTNVFGPVELINRLMRPNLEQQRKAVVINTLSGAGYTPTPGLPAYSASKSALWMITKWFAANLGPTIRVNAISPGVVTEDGQPRFAVGKALLENNGVPLGRLGAPEELAGAAVYLASDASSYTSGTVITCAGGLLSW